MLLYAEEEEERRARTRRCLAFPQGKGYTAGTKQLVSHVSGGMLRLQAALHAVLEGADARQLNYILATVNVAALAEVAPPHTLDLLVGPRLGQLSTVARSAGAGRRGGE